METRTSKFDDFKKGDRIGLVLGGGIFAQRVLDYCIAEKYPFHLIVLEGHFDGHIASGTPFERFRPERLHPIACSLRAAGCRHFLSVGRVARLPAFRLSPDFLTLFQLIWKGVLWRGDDAVLRFICAFLRSYGLVPLAPQQILPDLMPQTPACWTRKRPNRNAKRDIQRGIEVLASLSAADIGQAVVVQNGIVLGVEAGEGTDTLIRRCGVLRHSGRGSPGAVLIKMPKLGQSRVLDMPAIGPATIIAARAAGFDGIALRAGGILIADAVYTRQLVEQSELFFLILPAEKNQ